MMRFIVALLLLCNAFIAVGQTSAGEYVSIKDLKNSMGVNMKFIPPQGWNETVPKRPHIVKGYINPVDGSYMNILVIKLPTFISRNEFRKSMGDLYSVICEEYKNDKHFDSFTVLSHQSVTLDQYPFLMVNALIESHNYTRRSIYTILITAYEDIRIDICFYIQSEKADFSVPQKVINSIVFPDQYLTY